MKKATVIPTTHSTRLTNEIPETPKALQKEEDSEDDNGNTTLHKLIQQHPAEAIKLINLEFSLTTNQADLPDLNAPNSLGMTPLHVAVSQPPVVQALLNATCVKIDQRDHCGMTPLLHAVWQDQTVVAKMLLKAGADPRVREVEGGTALHYSSFNGNLELCKVFLDTIDVDVQDHNRVTAAHLAASNRHFGVLEALVARGANLDLKDRNGYTVRQLIN
jgi:ankyrin repeat protein